MINAFGSTLMKLRSENHESVGTMAEKLDVPRMTLSSIEVGREAVPEGMVAKIVEVYGLDEQAAAQLEEDSHFEIELGFGLDNAQGGFEFSQDRQITQAESNEIGKNK